MPSLVANFRRRDELALNCRNNASCDASTKVVWGLNCDTRTSFGQSISLDHFNSERSTTEFLDFRVERATSAHSLAKLATDDSLELLEDQSLEERCVKPVFERKLTPLERRLNQEFLDRRTSRYLGLDTLFDGIPDFRDRYHESRREGFQRTNRVRSSGGEGLGIRVAHGTSHRKHDELGHEFHDVRQGKICEVDIDSGLDVERHVSRRDGRDDLTVSDDDTLGLSR